MWKCTCGSANQDGQTVCPRCQRPRQGNPSAAAKPGTEGPPTKTSQASAGPRSRPATAAERRRRAGRERPYHALRFLAKLYIEGLSYSRGDETAADDLGTAYLYQAGFDPAAMASFFDVIWRSRNEPHLARFLLTHPPSVDRAARVRWRISAWPLDDRWVRDSAAFHEAQDLLRRSASAGP